MRQTIYALILCTLLNGCAAHFGQGWTKQDTGRQLAATTLHVLDWGTTRNIANSNGKYKEVNPILGEDPNISTVDMYFAATTIGSAVVSGFLNPEWRKRWQWVNIVVGAGVVGNNLSLGLKVNF